MKSVVIHTGRASRQWRERGFHVTGKRLFSGLTLALLWMALARPALSDDVLDSIIIDAGYDQQTRIAVVPFRSISDVSGQTPMSDIIAFDLARSGQFAPEEEGNMLSFPSQRAEVFFRDWRILGSEYLVVGRISGSEADGISVDYELYDVANERQTLAGQLTAPVGKWRDLAHRISDEVYEAITGVPGAYSTRIAYILARNAGTDYASYQLQIADSDGARARTLVESSEPLMSPSWSPDGRRLAYVSFEGRRHRIVLQDVATGEREVLPHFPGINGSPVYSPDGKHMALVLSRDGNPEVYVMNLADKQLRQITRHHAIDTEPSWSPDGRSLIFTSDRGGRPQIYQIDLSNNFVERLTYEGSYNARARLLSDGVHLVFVHRVKDVDHIAWQDLSRGTVNVLTETVLDESPSLAPNGAMLMYATLNEGRGILGVVSIDGRVRYRLPSSVGDVREPAWSPYMDTLNAPF